jgi:hypothetical protein
MPTHAEKNGGRRVLFPVKRANIAVFGLYDRAAGQLAAKALFASGLALLGIPQPVISTVLQPAARVFERIA